MPCLAEQPEGLYRSAHSAVVRSFSSSERKSSKSQRDIYRKESPRRSNHSASEKSLFHHSEPRRGCQFAQHSATSAAAPLSLLRERGSSTAPSTSWTSSLRRAAHIPSATISCPSGERGFRSKFNLLSRGSFGRHLVMEQTILRNRPRSPG